MSQKSVSVSKLAKLLDLKVFTKELDLKKHKVTLSDVNRPALQLSGYFEYFEPNRVQIIGMVEYSFLKQMDPDKRIEIYNALLEREIPCIIFSRDFEPDEDFLRIAEEKDVPLLGTHRTTSSFMAELILCLSEELAPCVTIHGVLVDVYGEGLLITGESGIGKSEAALELVRRGHRLVTDDVVEIRKINEHTLIGTSPDITRYFIELRGIGIINAIVLLCVTDNFQRFDNPRKFACYCGVAPFEHTSGISIRGKTQTSSLANKEVKVYLTRAAITAISWDPQMKAYYKRKIAEGKHKASVINAVRAKIIARSFAVIRRQTPFVTLAV